MKVDAAIPPALVRPLRSILVIAETALSFICW